MPPGFTMSWLCTETGLVTMRETVTLWPDASVPADGETVTWPSRLEDSAMDHVTGPPEAVSVRLPPRPGVSKILFGVTVSVPCFGGGGVAEGVLVTLVVLDDGAGEPGDVL